LLDGDGQNGKVYISAPPGYPEDPAYCYLLKRPLYGMSSAARAWFTTMSEFLQSEGCSKVGYEESMWRIDVLPKQGIQFNQHAYLGEKKTFFLCK
jgi:hypothetical protein